MSLSSKLNNRKKKIIGNTVAVAMDIGCGCRKLKLADAFCPRPKPKAPSNHQYCKPDLHSAPSSSTTSSWYKNGVFSVKDEDDTTTSFSTHSEAEASDSKKVKGFGRIDESVAVVKDSDDPYLDFRQSMLQMILEKEIYGREDLRHLLDCFLQLNSPYHHEIIVKAFSEIWNVFFSSVRQQQQPCCSSGFASASLKPRRK